MKGHVNSRSVSSLSGAKKEKFIWEIKLKGFGVRVSPKGKKTFIVQTRVRKQLIRKSLGTFPNISATYARSLAIEEFKKIALSNAGIKSISKASNVLLGEFAEKHWNTLTRGLKPTTAKRYRSSLILQIIPEFGDTLITEISHSRIVAWHASMKDKPGSANHAIPVLKKVFTLAGQLELVSKNQNPASKIKRHRLKTHDRILSSQELRSLGKTLSYNFTKYPTKTLALLFLILTGCREKEVLNMQWANIEGNQYFFPDTKTGPRTMYLPRSVRSILELQLQYCGDSNWIFPAVRNPEKPCLSLFEFWKRVCVDANLPNVRLHDLRHNYASWAAMNGIDLFLIGKMLGQKSIESTNRYVHYLKCSIASLTRTAQNAIANFMGGFNDRDSK